MSRSYQLQSAVFVQELPSEEQNPPLRLVWRRIEK